MNTTIKKRIEEINSGGVPEGYEKTSFGIFPCDWEKSKTLKDLGKFGKGRGIPGNKLISKGVPCVGYGDIYMKYNYHFEKAQSFVDENTAAESQKIRKGTLLFTATGETAEEIGKCVCYNGEEDIYAGGDIITCIPDRINSMFIAYQQYQNYALRQKVSFGQGHSVVHIQKERLEKLHIAYPQSAQEQSRIAEILMQWDKAIELQEKLIKLYQKLKKYYLSKMFPKKGSQYPEIRFAGFTEPWEVRKFGELLQTLSYKPFIKEPEQNGEYEVIQQGNNPIIGFANGTPCNDYEDVVIFGDHTLSLYKPKRPFFVATDGVRIVKGKQKTDGYYLLSILERYKPQSEGYKRYYSILADEECFTTSNTKEQKQIGFYFYDLDNLINRYQNKLDKLIEQRKALQQYLLTGIVRV